MSKENVIYLEYYSALRKEGNPVIHYAWMNIEEIVLSEISQSRKDRFCMIPFI
jgi:hypothetical protein